MLHKQQPVGPPEGNAGVEQVGALCLRVGEIKVLHFTTDLLLNHLHFLFFIFVYSLHIKL